MKMLGYVLSVLLVSHALTAQEAKKSEAKEEADRPLLVKIIADLGVSGKHPGHPSSNCQINTQTHAMINHDLDDKEYHVTTAKSKAVKWENLEEVASKIEEAAKLELKTTKNFVRAHEPSVRYAAVHYETVTTEVAGEKVEFTKPKVVELYTAAGAEQQREGDSVKWLIDFVDENCPNDKPFAELELP